MNSGTVSQLLEVPCRTLQRWTELYADFLLPDATPSKGQTRLFSEHDVRILKFVSDQRREGKAHNAIKQVLVDASDDEWQVLPGLPETWQHMDSSIVIPNQVLEQLQHQQVMQSEQIEQQRKMLQVAAAAVQVSTAQKVESERRARVFERRQWTYFMLMVAVTAMYWVVVLFVLLI
jgi:DNA-binding transcriptional MerR regulator